MTSSMVFMLSGGPQVGMPHFFPHPRLFLLVYLLRNFGLADLLLSFAFNQVRLFLNVRI